MARILTVFVIAVILAACSPDPAPPKEPSYYFGTNLKLSGDVYIRNINFDFENFDPENIFISLLPLIVNPTALVTYTPADNTLDLIISDGDLGGSGKIKTGKLSYSIGVPEDNLVSITEVLSILLSQSALLPDDVDLPDIEISSNTAQAALLSLTTNDADFILVTRENIGFNQSLQISAETVNYIYVDENVIITVPSSTNSYTVSDISIAEETTMDIPVSLTTGKIDLKLRKGWNVIHNTLIITWNITSFEPPVFEADGALNIKLGNPSSLKWVLSGNNQPIQ